MITYVQILPVGVQQWNTARRWDWAWGCWGWCESRGRPAGRAAASRSPRPGRGWSRAASPRRPWRRDASLTCSESCFHQENPGIKQVHCQYYMHIIYNLSDKISSPLQYWQCQLALKGQNYKEKDCEQTLNGVRFAASFIMLLSSTLSFSTSSTAKQVGPPFTIWVIVPKPMVIKYNNTQSRLVCF